MGAEFLSRFLPPTHKGVSVYVADPTYVNHLPIFKLNGFEIKRYRYYDPNTNGLDLKGFVEDLQVRRPPSQLSSTFLSYDSRSILTGMCACLAFLLR